MVAVAPGTYHGAAITPRPGAGDRAYVHFLALGRPGEVVVLGAAEGDPFRSCLLVRASYIIVQGFNIAGAAAPGREPALTVSGVNIGGGFAAIGRRTRGLPLQRRG